MSDEVQVTPRLLERLERLAKDASPGPWKPHRSDRGPFRCTVIESRGTYAIANIHSAETSARPERRWANAEYVAAADPLTVLALVSHIRALEKENEELRNATEEVWTPDGE